MTEKIKLENHRLSDYYLNYVSADKVKSYHFPGAVNGRVSSKLVDKDIVEHLTMTSSCFKNGDLIIVGEPDVVEDIKEGIADVEEYEANALTREKALSILQGNANKMKAELNKVTSQDSKAFVIDLAKEIKLDSNAKLTFLAEWFGVKKSDLFDE